MRRGRHSLEVMNLVAQLALRIDHSQDQWKIVKVVNLMTTTHALVHAQDNSPKCVMVFNVGEQWLINLGQVDLTPPTRNIEKT
jgi:hypothetical protein